MTYYTIEIEDCDGYDALYEVRATSESQAKRAAVELFRQSSSRAKSSDIITIRVYH